MTLKAVVLAGGEGVRMQPLTFTRPKSMLPIGTNPIIDYVLAHLIRGGFQEIIIAVGYKKEQIIDHVGDGSQHGIKVSYVAEPRGERFGTAGVLRLAEHLLDDMFLVAQADNLTDIPLAEVVNFSQKHEGDATIVLTEVEDPSQFGVAVLDEGGRIKNFQEKPTPAQALSYLVNAGFYILKPEVLDHIQPKWDFAHDLFPHLLKIGKTMFGYPYKGFWVDVGQLGGFLRGLSWIIDRESLGISTTKMTLEGSVIIGSDLTIEEGAQIHGPSLIESNVRIARGARIKPYSIIKERSEVGEDTVVDQAIVMEGSSIGPRSTIKSSIIGEVAKVGANVEVKDAIVGQGCDVGDNAKVLLGSRIWPNISIRPWEVVEGIVAVPREKAFYFNEGVGRYVGILGSTLGEFIKGLEQVSVKSIEFHIERRDFERWAMDVLGSCELSEKIGTLRKSRLEAEALRHQLINIMKEWNRENYDPTIFSKKESNSILSDIEAEKNGQ